MTTRLYLIPITHLTDPIYNVPKYLPHRYNPSLAGLEGVRWAWETYLLEDTGLIVADVDNTQHTLLSAQADVLAVPPLDNTISSAAVRNQVRNALEAVNVPGLWIVTGMSYRSVIRVVLGMWQFHNRLAAIIQHKIFDGTIDLEMTVANIPLATRDQLQIAADELGLDYSAVTGSTTVRQLLKVMGDQFAGTEFNIGGFII